ncbi:MAG: hypothetical protein ACQGVK_02110 [Myxococcota bacterium]
MLGRSLSREWSLDLGSLLHVEIDFHDDPAMLLDLGPTTSKLVLKMKHRSRTTGTRIDPKLAKWRRGRLRLKLEAPLQRGAREPAP